MKQFSWGWKITIIWSAIGSTAFVASLIESAVNH